MISREEYYKKKKKDAVAQMAALCENPVEDSWRGIHEAKAYVYKYGTSNDKSNADLIESMWSHFNCELMTYEEMKEMKQERMDKEA